MSTDHKQTTVYDWDKCQSLPPAQCRDYLACERWGYSQREWAVEIGKSRGTVGENVRKAKEALGEIDDE